MNWLGQLLGSEWEISPAGGATGDAYYAEHNGQQLFLSATALLFWLSCPRKELFLSSFGQNEWKTGM